MKPEQLSQAKDKDLPASLIAMQRAARMAREEAVRTDTGIVVSKTTRSCTFPRTNCVKRVFGEGAARFY